MDDDNREICVICSRLNKKCVFVSVVLQLPVNACQKSALHISIASKIASAFSFLAISRGNPTDMYHLQYYPQLVLSIQTMAPPPMKSARLETFLSEAKSRSSSVLIAAAATSTWRLSSALECRFDLWLLWHGELGVGQRQPQFIQVWRLVSGALFQSPASLKYNASFALADFGAQ